MQAWDGHRGVAGADRGERAADGGVRHRGEAELAGACDLQAEAGGAGEAAVLHVQIPVHVCERDAGHGMEHEPRREEDEVRRVHAEMLAGRAAAVLQRAEGRHEPGGDQAAHGGRVGEVPSPPPGQAGGSSRDHGAVAGQRQEQNHGLRGSGKAGHKVHHRVEHGAGPADPAEDGEGGVRQGRGHVRGTGDTKTGKDEAA